MGLYVPIVKNQSELDFELCDGVETVTSNAATTGIVEITMNKVADCNMALLGGNICYTVTISNTSAAYRLSTTFRDMLPDELQYVDGSFTVNGVQQTPDVDGQEITYTFELLVEDTVIKFCTKVIAVPTDDTAD